MTEVCEVAESYASAVSTCPATDIVLVLPTSASCTSSAMLFIGPGVLDSTAAAVSAVTPSSYAVALNTANATSTATASSVAERFVESDANARSSTIAFLYDTLVSTAAANSSIQHASADTFLYSTAQAVSVVTVNTTATQLLLNVANAASSVVVGRQESVESTAAAVSTVTLLRNVNVSETSTAGSTSTVYASNTPATVLLVSAADSTSTATHQLVATSLLESAADANSGVSFKNPDAKAWLMNTESSAVQWYDNFDFESIAQINGKTLAVGPDGLYELTGGNDAGDNIDATVEYGFNDFGVLETKRLDVMYFGYNSDGTLTAEVATYGSSHAPTTYTLEVRDADAPRNTRVTPGKGLSGRYWRMTLRNVGGADFEVHSTTADIAVSTRRI